MILAIPGASVSSPLIRHVAQATLVIHTGGHNGRNRRIKLQRTCTRHI
jgi:hypothetical protein